MSQEIRTLLQGLGSAEDGGVLTITYFDHDVTMTARRARDPRLLRGLDETIERLQHVQESLLVRPDIRFVPVKGWQSRDIAYTPQNRRSRLAWLRRGLRSGVFNGTPRGIVAVLSESGRHGIFVRGEARGMLPALMAARDAVRVLTGRSNRGELIGPYWHRAVGIDVGELLPRSDAPSTLAPFFDD